jgi:hypothetical protein
MVPWKGGVAALVSYTELIVSGGMPIPYRGSVEIGRDAMVGKSPYLNAASKGALYLPRAPRYREKQMNTGIGRAQLGRWYRHLDKGEIFRVVGLDTESRSIVIQNVDGELDEIDEESWVTLPLGWAEPPEHFTNPLAVDINACEYAKLFD